MSLFEEKTGKPFHVLLREFRNNLGLTQKEFSEKYSMSVRTYIHWEYGKGGPKLPEYVDLILDFFKYLSTRY
jgi:transcriptional regulator with XRE-family HTH domain